MSSPWSLLKNHTFCKTINYVNKTIYCTGLLGHNVTLVLHTSLHYRQQIIRVYATDIQTHINIAKQIIEATVAVVRGAAESLEHTQPLSTERATVCRQLRTQDTNIIHPETKHTTFANHRSRCSYRCHAAVLLSLKMLMEMTSVLRAMVFDSLITWH